MSLSQIFVSNLSFRLREDDPNDVFLIKDGHLSTLNMDDRDHIAYFGWSVRNYLLRLLDTHLWTNHKIFVLSEDQVLSLPLSDFLEYVRERYAFRYMDEKEFLDILDGLAFPLQMNRGIVVRSTEETKAYLGTLLMSEESMFKDPFI